MRLLALSLYRYRSRRRGGVGARINEGASLAPSTTSFVTPPGVLEFGKHYSFEVELDDFATAQGFGTFVSNRSETWSDLVSPVPGPTTGAGSLEAAEAGEACNRKAD
jgi:hypothetical protein